MCHKRFLFNSNYTKHYTYNQIKRQHIHKKYFKVTYIFQLFSFCEIATFCYPLTTPIFRGLKLTQDQLQ